MGSTTAGAAACIGRCAAFSRAVAAPGGECGELGDTEAAIATTCPDGYFCNNANTADVTRTCAERTPRGAACDSGENLCAEAGDGCLPADDGGRRCRPVVVRGSAGEACAEDVASELGICNGLAGLMCVDGACVAAGDGREGARCGGAPLPAACALGFNCIAGSCRASLAAGAACDADEQCASGFCDGVCSGACGG